jgi:hypothetical protein
LVSDDNQVLYNSIKTFCNDCGILMMSNSEADQVRKQKLLQRIHSLSPGARLAILLAALEQKALQAYNKESQDILQDNRRNGSVK